MLGAGPSVQADLLHASQRLQALQAGFVLASLSFQVPDNPSVISSCQAELAEKMRSLTCFQETASEASSGKLELDGIAEVVPESTSAIFKGCEA